MTKTVTFGFRKFGFGKRLPVFMVTYPSLSPLTLFSNGEIGIWFDPSDLTTMFQESAGKTAASVDNAVGLILDKARSIGIDSTELILNGAFGTDTTSWSAGNSATLTATGGRLRVAYNGVSTPYAHQSFATVIGSWYRIAIDTYQGTAASAPTIRIGTAAGGTQNMSVQNAATGQALYFRATATTTYISLVSSATSGLYSEFDNVSVRLSNGYHAQNATGAQQPILRQDANGLYYLEFDGVDDRLAGSTFTMTQPYSRISAVQQISWTISDMLFGANGSVTEGDLACRTSSPTIALTLNGLSAAAPNSDFAIGTNGVVTELVNGTSGSSLQINRLAPTASASGNANPAGIMLCANRFGAGNANMRLYGVVMVNRIVTAAEKGGVQTFMAAKAGVTL